MKKIINKIKLFNRKRKFQSYEKYEYLLGTKSILAHIDFCIKMNEARGLRDDWNADLKYLKDLIKEGYFQNEKE